MTRLGLALVAALIPSVGLAESPSKDHPSANLEVPSDRLPAPTSRYALPSDNLFQGIDPAGGLFAGRQVAPGKTVGFGMFGIKRESGRQAPVTSSEIFTPRQRRVGVGFSLKF